MTLYFKLYFSTVFKNFLIMCSLTSSPVTWNTSWHKSLAAIDLYGRFINHSTRVLAYSDINSFLLRPCSLFFIFHITVVFFSNSVIRWLGNLISRSNSMMITRDAFRIAEIGTSLFRCLRVTLFSFSSGVHENRSQHQKICRVGWRLLLADLHLAKYSKAYLRKVGVDYQNCWQYYFQRFSP